MGGGGWAQKGHFGPFSPTTVAILAHGRDHRGIFLVFLDGFGAFFGSF
ncbi:uncharacterized protein G2W53_018173 [Senna tora]|uniref:Uncharacterized protein n=1 Tax=Senna tora TaxID=362788 RepID=A0A834U032_9FABA|nr:uncharacterized protein G2W53_018173 [Senna tora]